MIGESLRVIYSPDPAEIGARYDLTEGDKLFYGEKGYIRDSWEKPYNLDRLKVEGMVDHGFPMRIVLVGMLPPYRVNALLNPAFSSDIELPDSNQFFLDILQRPEHRWLLWGNFGSITEITRNKKMSLLTELDVTTLEAWARVNYLKGLQPYVAKSPNSEWRMQMEETQRWMDEKKITIDYQPGEDFYKYVIKRVIKDMLSVKGGEGKTGNFSGAIQKI